MSKLPTVLGGRLLLEGVDVSEDTPEIVLEPESVYGKSKGPRLVLSVLNEGGHNGTSVDLLQLINWLQSNAPELLNDPLGKQG